MKLLKPLVVWKNRKGDEAIPSKHDALIERWYKTKHRADLSFEEALKETSIFATYKKETGRDLTMNIVHAKLNITTDNDDLDTINTIAKRDDNVDVNSASVTEV